MTKILIVNLHSSRNAGDDVLTRVTEAQLLENFAQAELTLAMNDPASCRGGGTAVGSFTTWCKDERGRWRPFAGLFWLLVSLWLLVGYRLGYRPGLNWLPAAKRPLPQAYFDADLVVSSAGNFLYSSGFFGLPFLLAIYAIAYAHWAQKPVYAMPQTIGPLRRRWEEKLTAWAVNRMRLAFVRDDVSLALLQRLSIDPNRYQLNPDIAFALPASPADEGKNLLTQVATNQYPSPRVGLTLIDWGRQNRLFQGQAAYEAAVVAAFRQFLAEYGGQLFLFAQVRGPSEAENDLNPARRIQTQLADLGDRVVLVAPEVQPEILKAAYGQMDFLVGSRLHSNIFALSEGTPVVTIQYQYKTLGMLRMLNLAEWVILIEEVEAAPLLALLRKMWTGLDRHRAQVARAAPPIVAEAQRVGAKIAADFTANHKAL